MKTFVITLPEAKARQDHMIKILGDQAIDFEFFDAVDGRGFDVPAHEIYDKTRRRLYFGRDMTGGEIGLLLSYKNIFQKMVDEQIDLALILEDDVVLEPNFKAVLDALVNGSHDFDYIRFLGSAKVAKLKQYAKRSVIGDYTLNRLRTTPGGTHANLVTLAGARKLLAALDKVWLPIDALVGRPWLHGLNHFIIQPGLAEQDQAQEQYIGANRFTKRNDLSGWMRYAHPLARGWLKLYEGFMKPVYYYRYYLSDKVLGNTNENQ